MNSSLRRYNPRARANARSALTTRIAFGALGLSLLSTAATADRVRYRLEIVNTWSEETHPGAFPEDAHFSWFGGATHDDRVSFWEVGERASPGIKQMAEDGRTLVLTGEEIAAAIEARTADRSLSYRWWICPHGIRADACGESVVEFDIDERWPLVTLVSMLGPSPDWFIGVSGLALRENDRWLPSVVVDLTPYDAGTRSPNRFALFGSETSPPDLIQPITEESGQLIGPGSLGELRFTLLAPRQTPGDCNADGRLDISDAMCILLVLFGGRAEGFPCGDGTATDAANRMLLDWQADGDVNIADAVAILQSLFADGPEHALSGPPGESPRCVTIDTCETAPGCE